MSGVRVAIVGAGRMGTHHARVVAETPGVRLGVVVDADPLRAELLASGHGCPASSRLDPVLGCDAAIVATPPATHRDISIALLDAGVPLLVEKPLSDDLDEVRSILDTARTRRVPLTCGFVERHNPVVETVRGLLREDGLARHLVALRHSPPDPVATTHVVYDLLIHDIDLALLLCGESWSGRITGTVGAPGGLDVADCTLTTVRGDVITCSASRAAHRKTRRLELSTPERQLSVDLLRRTLTVYQHVQHESVRGGYRAQTVLELPFVRELGEPLAIQLRHFLALVRGEADPELERETLLPPHEVAAALLRGTLEPAPAVASR